MTELAAESLAVAELPLASVAAAQAKPRWLVYGDTVRIVGTLAVVLGHVADMPLFCDQKNTFGAMWWAGNIVNCLVRWAVPAYIMLSGALMLDPERCETPVRFYRKRLHRIGIPLVFWSIFFMLFAVYYTGWDTWPKVIHKTLNAGPYPHMHFIYRIAGLYAMVPVLRVFLRHCTRGMLAGVVIGLLVLASADSVRNGLTHTETSVFVKFAPFLGYFLAGYLLREAQVTRKTLWWCAAVFIACAVILALGTAAMVKYYEPSHKIEGYPSVSMLLYDFLSPVRVIMALVSWLLIVNLLKRPWPRSETARAWWGYLASLTLGIYLIHPAIRDALHIHGYSAERFGPWLGIPVVALMVYVPSAALVAIIDRIPYLRRIIG